MNDVHEETGVHAAPRPRPLRTDLEIAAIVLTVTESTFTACALAAAAILTSRLTSRFRRDLRRQFSRRIS